MGSKTKVQMRADLAIDLKITIDTELSKAELNRCIDRAFSDMSRFLPDEKIFEDSLQFAVADEERKFPVDTAATRIVNGATLNGVSDGATVTIANQPDVPRPLTMTVTDLNGSITNMSVIVKGTDENDEAIQETFHHVAWLAPVVGKKYFKTVNEVEIDQVEGNGSGDELSIGVGAYTDVWVYLANSPIKRNSDSGVGDDDVAIVKNTDYYIDYANGRVKAIADGLIAAGETCEFTYKKSQIGIDISDLPGLIRVQRVEYPVGDIPQNFVTGDVFGKYYVVTGSGESGEQEQMAEDKQYRIYYDAQHHPPSEYAVGTEPGFLTDTTLMAAGAYALYILALKQEHQAVTDIASARTALGNATGTHSALVVHLTDLKKYLDNNNTTDAAGLLDDVNNADEDLRHEIETALAAMNSYLDTVGKATSGDLALATLAREKYMGTTANYVDGGTAPDIKKYLDDGDAILNTVAVGGEGADVPRAYREYAQTVKEALVAAHEQDRAFYQQNATARTNAAMGYANEAAQHLSFLRSFVERAAGYMAIANTFGTAAEHRLSQIMSYLQQASQCMGAAATDMSLADRFKAEADERRNEVYSIWRDRKQYIGDFTAGAMRQMPDYK